MSTLASNCRSDIISEEKRPCSVHIVQGVAKLELPLTTPKYQRRARDGLLLTVSKIYLS